MSLDHAAWEAFEVDQIGLLAPITTRITKKTLSKHLRKPTYNPNGFFLLNALKTLNTYTCLGTYGATWCLMF